MIFDSDDLDRIAAGDYTLEDVQLANDYVEAQPEMVGEIATHALLLNMEDDELFHHLKNPVLMNKFVEAKRKVMADVAAGVPWGSIYE